MELKLFCIFLLLFMADVVELGILDTGSLPPGFFKFLVWEEEEKPLSVLLPWAWVVVWGASDSLIVLSPVPGWVWLLRCFMSNEANSLSS